MDHPFDEHVAIFWDYENCAPPCSVPGYDVVNNIRQVAHEYGSVKLFKAYLELSELSSSKSIGLRSELQSCGVSLTDCPHNGRKDVADKMMIVDMLTYAIDNPAPATIVLISGDRDFVYAVSVLRLRKYRVVVVAPNSAHTSLKSQASAVLDWDADIMRKTTIRPQTIDASSHSPSDDAGLRSPRRMSFGGQPPQSTMGRSAHRLSFRGAGGVGAAPMTPVTPADASNGSGAGSFFQGRHLRNPSIVTMDESSSVEARTAGLAIPGMSDAYRDSGMSAKGLREGGEMDARQPPITIKDIVEIMRDHKNTRSQAFDSLPNRPSTDMTNTENASAPSVTSVTHPGPDFSQTSSDGRPPSGPVESGYIGHDRSHYIGDPTSAPPIRVNARAIVVPESLRFPCCESEQPILRPATVQPISRVLSDAPSPVSIVSSSEDSLHSSSSVTTDTSHSSPSDGTDDSSPKSTPDLNLPTTVSPANADSSRLPPSLAYATVQTTLEPAKPAPLPNAVPVYFRHLIAVLEDLRMKGSNKPLRTTVAVRLLQIARNIYAQAGTKSFREFSYAAVKAGIITLGGTMGDAWVALNPEWHGTVLAESVAS